MLKSGDICTNLRSALPSRGRSLDSVFCIVKLTDKYMYLEYKSSYLTGLGSSTEWLYSVVLYTPRGRRSAPLSITIFSSRNPSQHSCSSITITPLKQFQKFHGRRNSPRCLRRNLIQREKEKSCPPHRRLTLLSQQEPSQKSSHLHTPLQPTQSLTDTSQNSITKHNAVLRSLARPRPVHDGRCPTGPGAAIPATRGRGR